MILDDVLGPERTQNWINVLGKRWLGDPRNPASPASITAKLGYDLFTTRGMAPSRRQRFLQKLQEDSVKELIRIIGAVALAGILVWLGLSRP